ncbi:MAG: PPC domain-containing DNA-binding protein [Phormidesmis sp.]
MEHSQLSVIAIRLKPKTDIRQQLELIAKEQNISAGVILGAVGSLSQTCLRFAGSDEHTTLEGKHEILTLSGMLSKAGVHLHMSVSDSNGRCVGGHVVDGCQVYTTLEVVIGLMPHITFQREMDLTTKFPELLITPHRDIFADKP